MGRRWLEAVMVAVFFSGLVGPSLVRGQTIDQEPPESMVEAQRHRQSLFSEIAPSVVFLAADNEVGTAFFVSDDGYALTNQHVVGDAEELTAILRDGQKVDAEVVERADEVDLALVKVSVSSSAAVTLGGMGETSVGSWVGSIGHGAGRIWTFTKGIVTNIYAAGQKRPFFQTQIPVNKGASGSPVFDLQGRVIGVITSGITNTNSVNFAIRTDVAFETLDRLSEHCRCLTVKAPEGTPIFVNGKSWGKGPEVVIPIQEKTEFEVFGVIEGAMHKTTVSFPETRVVDLEKVEGK